MVCSELITVLRHRLKIAALERITEFLDKFKNKPAKFIQLAFNYLTVPCLNISPRSIFGNKFIATPRVIRQVLFLKRVADKSDEINIVSAAPDEIIKTSNKILFHEWHNQIQYLLIYSSMSDFSINSLYNNTEKIIRENLQTRPCSYVNIPISFSNKKMQVAFSKFFDNGNQLRK